MVYDSRNISYNDDFKKSNPLDSFRNLVKNNENTLELCYRGNTSDGDICRIYFNNHILFEIKKFKRNQEYRLTINYNNSKYFEKREKLLKDELLKNYGFSLDKYGYLKCHKNEFSKEYVEKLFKLYIPVMESFFDPQKTYNYKDPANKNKKKIFLEKMRQQQIMRTLKEHHDGYFIYDLEFAQPHQDKQAKKEDKNNNKPDMTALKFENGEVKKIVFIEVKSTEEASKNRASNLETHIKKMKKNLDDDINLNNRKDEAFDLFNNYAELELRGLEAKDILKDKQALRSVKSEIMVIFTDTAIDYYNNNKEEIRKIEGVVVSTFDENGEGKLLVK